MLKNTFKILSKSECLCLFISYKKIKERTTYKCIIPGFWERRLLILRTRLVESVIVLAKNLVLKWRPNNYWKFDYLSHVLYKITLSVDVYDPYRIPRTQWSSYVWRVVKRAIVDVDRDSLIKTKSDKEQTNFVRKALKNRVDASFYLGTYVEKIDEHPEYRAILKEALLLLPTNERYVIVERLNGKTASILGKEFLVSRQAIDQVEYKAYRRLRGFVQSLCKKYKITFQELDDRESFGKLHRRKV